MQAIPDLRSLDHHVLETAFEEPVRLKILEHAKTPGCPGGTYSEFLRHSFLLMVLTENSLYRAMIRGSALHQ
jgi:hypothetical protein